VGYSLETTKKDLQVDQCKRGFGTLGGHRSINSETASGFWKEKHSLPCLFFLYFKPTQTHHYKQGTGQRHYHA
jgi:hypothetical protein